MAVQKDNDFHSIYINLSTNDELKADSIGTQTKTYTNGTVLFQSGK
ncbi:hypothetical protein RCO48_27975 [Peribacillus frigoritolerans]|nr:hypothetical protein [Peribacillus frigoritolerans]